MVLTVSLTLIVLMLNFHIESWVGDNEKGRNPGKVFHNSIQFLFTVDLTSFLSWCFLRGGALYRQNGTLFFSSSRVSIWYIEIRSGPRYALMGPCTDFTHEDQFTSHIEYN